MVQSNKAQSLEVEVKNSIIGRNFRNNLLCQNVIVRIYYARMSEWSAVIYICTHVKFFGMINNQLNPLHS